MNIQPLAIKNTIYRTSKYTLTLFIPPIETSMLGKAYYVSPKSYLYFALPPGPSDSPEKRKTKSFSINRNNLYSIVKFFNTIVEWFYDAEKKDLFLVNDENQLIFNPKYNDLSVKSKKGYYSDEQMKAVPAVIEVANQIYEEGIYLFVNQLDNMVRLTVGEVEQILGILSTFDFTAEMILAYDSLRMSMLTNTVLSEDQLKERRNMGYPKKPGVNWS